MIDAEQCEITIDFESDTLNLIKIAAKMCNEPVSDFIVEASSAKAVKTVLTGKVTFMSDEAYQSVCKTLFTRDW